MHQGARLRPANLGWELVRLHHLAARHERHMFVVVPLMSMPDSLAMPHDVDYLRSPFPHVMATISMSCPCFCGMRMIMNAPGVMLWNDIMVN